jgi:hypothetical protein
MLSYEFKKKTILPIQQIIPKSHFTKSSKIIGYVQKQQSLRIKTMHSKWFNPSMKFVIDPTAEPNTTADGWHLHNKKGPVADTSSLHETYAFHSVHRKLFITRDDKTSFLLWRCLCCSLLVILFYRRFHSTRNTGWSKNLCAPDDYSKNTQKYFKQFQTLTMIMQLQCAPCYTKHGLREHSSACQ